MSRVDRRLPEEYGITVYRMMENAGYQVAQFVRKEIDPEGITVYAGKGNNGGDAMAAARRLHIWGYKVEVVLATSELEGIREEELQILEKLDLTVSENSPENNFPLALEGLIGYNIEGDPRPPFDSMVEDVNRYETVVSIDIPTGLDPDTGEKSDPCVNPDYTVTLGAMFKGMKETNSGQIWLADISIPSELLEELNFSSNLFRNKSLRRLRS